ncbi:MAG TPA: alternative ribosome rescue aminoacyl-tRNA hydrolase ArfB [Actinomycetota bacterium]
MRTSVRAGASTIPLDELRIRFVRSPGPGGQNVNRRATKAEVVLDVDASPSLPATAKARIRRALGTRVDSRGRIRVTASAERTQAQNRERALARLEELLSGALRPPPPPRKPSAPTRGAIERRLEEKRRRRARKQLRRRPGPDD